MVHPLEITREDVDKKKKELNNLLKSLEKKVGDNVYESYTIFDDEFIREKSRHMEIITPDPRAQLYRDYKRAEYVIEKIKEKYGIK